jgi:RNA polymerase sigma factor (sigma-70 family)
MGQEATARSMEELLRHAGWARRLAAALAGGRDAGEDLLQDTFGAAAAHPPADAGSLRAWLRRVMVNQRSKRRLADRRRQAREAEVATREAGERASSPEDLLGRMEVQRLLAEVVMAVPEPYRQTLLLRYYEERSAAEIARALDSPAGTIRWRLKQGLALVRAELERRAAEDGRSWLRMIAPLVGASARRRWPWRPLLGWTLAAGLVAGLGGLVALVRGPVRIDGGPGRPVAAVIAVERPAPPTPPLAGAVTAPPAPPAAAPVSAAFAACRTDVTRLRVQVADAENEALSVVSPHTLFRRGAPNPTAEAKLGPELERVLRGTRSAPPAHTLECRTWACKLTVLETNEEMRRPDHWIGPLQRDPVIGFAQSMTRRFMFASAGRVRDPVADVPLNRQFVFISLADSSGSRREYGQPLAGKGYGRLPLVRPPSSRPPAMLAACRSEHAQLRGRLHAARRDLREHGRPSDHFAESPPADALTAELTRELRRVGRTLAPAATPAAECRGDICRLTGLEPLPAWRKALGSDGYFRQRLGMQAVGMGDRWYATLKSAEEMATTRWLARLLDRVAAPAELTGCAAEHPQAAGRLSVTLAFEGLESSPGSESIDVQLGSELGGTRLADCVTDVVRRALAGERPPGGAVSTLSTSASSTVTFPLGLP